MNCMNCDRELNDNNLSPDQGTAKVYAGVLVCLQCFNNAERMTSRLQQDLIDCMLIVKDKTRELLATGRFFCANEEANPGVSKKDLLTAITKLYTPSDGTHHTE
jgi:hypothetical protein